MAPIPPVLDLSAQCYRRLIHPTAPALQLWMAHALSTMTQNSGDPGIIWRALPGSTEPHQQLQGSARHGGCPVPCREMVPTKCKTAYLSDVLIHFPWVHLASRFKLTLNLDRKRHFTGNECTHQHSQAKVSHLWLAERNDNCPLPTPTTTEKILQPKGFYFVSKNPCAIFYASHNPLLSQDFPFQKCIIVKRKPAPAAGVL